MKPFPSKVFIRFLSCMFMQGRNIVLLLLDTVRASALAEHGMPTIKRMAKRGTYYSAAVAPGTWTAPSHASLFTNTRVTEIPGVSKDFFGKEEIDPWMVKNRFLNGSEPTIASRLSGIGYQTTLLSNNPFLTSLTNLGSGFENIYDVWKESNIKYNKGLAERLSVIINSGSSARQKMYMASYLCTRMLPSNALDLLYMELRNRLNEGVSKAEGRNRLDKGASNANRALKDYLEHKYNYGPQFIFMNYIEAHENYPAKVAQDKWLYMSGILEMNETVTKQLYKGYLKRIRYLDRKISEAISIMKHRGVLDNATLIITSDHGQMFGEHGMLYHSLQPYEGISRVPLISVNFTNGKIDSEPERFDGPAPMNRLHGAMFDIASWKNEFLNGQLKGSRYTVSEHTGISEGWDEALLRMLKPRSKSAARIYEAKRINNMHVTAVYHKNMKLMHYFGARADLMYDLANDPAESYNVINKHRALAKEMASQARPTQPSWTGPT